MDMRQVLAAEQVRYHKIIKIVEDILKRMDIKPTTKIFVHPMYPYAWEAAVGINDGRNTAYRFYCDLVDDSISMREEHVVGFYPSGALKTETAYKINYEDLVEECKCGLCGFA